MSENQITPRAERMSPDEFSFWRRAFIAALPDCRDHEAAEGCAHIAAETAYASVREFRAAANQVQS